ncbi:hypothetical protein MLD38_007273 [Melastoma candidum]|uniref:Uncharacterized protein n=1 Tax=Melastoma candidum TaxID=119954 RepID=A0ACB9RR51_9MYRT|nr:hypothetical protein MLD38_007273 [Melastoma candidum]
MPPRNIPSYNSLLSSYVQDGDALGAWNLFLCLYRCRAALDAYTFTSVLSACQELPNHPVCGRQVHGLMVRMGADSGTVSKTAIVKLYSVYGSISEAVKAFEEIEHKDVISWNVLISSFLKTGFANEGIGVFGRMQRENVEFSEYTLCNVLKACAMGKAYRQGKQVHGAVITMGRDLVVLGTALIDFYSSVGCIEEALKVYGCFCHAGDRPMHNSILSACVRNKKYKQAFQIMSSMRPNIISLTSALAACSECSDFSIGKQIHCAVLRYGFTMDCQLSNALLDMYAKCGDINAAKIMFDRISKKDVFTWTTMIDAYGIHGCGLEAFELFHKMGEYAGDASPNNITLLSVLSACGHSGLVDKGRLCFDLARNKYGIEADPEHYACFIHGLGRAGLIEDAWAVYHEMVKGNFEPSPIIWAALLNASSLNQDFIRGEYAARHLMELERNKPANYVLVSNFYAAVGRWDIVDEVRRRILEKGQLKEAGSSRFYANPSTANHVKL